MAKTTSSKRELPLKRQSELFKKRQSQIVKMAAKLFVKKTYTNTSMREISRTTGIDASNLYHFAGGKEMILFKVFEVIHGPSAEIFDKSGVMNIENPVEQLKTAIRRLIYFGFDYRKEIQMLYRESKVLPKKLIKVIMKNESYLVAQIAEILKRGKEKKVFQFEDASFTANLIVYDLSLYAMRSWNMKKYSKDEFIDLFEKHYLRALVI